MNDDPFSLLKLGSLDDLQEGDVLLSPNSIDYSRPLTEYGTAQDIVNHLSQGKPKEYIYIDDLRKYNELASIRKDSFVQYLGDRDYQYQSSTIKAALESPVHLYFALNEEWKIKIDKVRGEQKHFTLGTYLHECILEPTKFSRTIYEPYKRLNRKDEVQDLIDFWEKTIAEKGTDRDVVISDEWNMALIDGMKSYYYELRNASGLASVKKNEQIIIDSVRFHYDRYGGGILHDLVTKTHRETSIYVTEPESGLNVKIRPDAMAFAENVGQNTIISIKSTSTPTINKFEYDSAKYKYHLSEAFYQDIATLATGRDFNTTITIMLQTTPPYGVAAFIWDPEDIEWGKYAYKQALDICKQCKEEDLYPGYDIRAESGNYGLIDMKLPDWIRRDIKPLELFI